MTARELIGYVFFFFAVVFVAILAFGSWGTTTAGHRGIVLRLGAVTGEVKGEGLYGKTPWLDSIIEMNVQIQKVQVDTEGASKDLQHVKSEVALNMNVLPEKCPMLYQTVGTEYLDRVVTPALQEATKAVQAQFTAEELITKREHVREAMSRLVTTKLEPFGIRVESFNILHFDFSKAFNEAIEQKVTAEQNALAAKNLLVQKEFEAKQAVAVAKGKAEAMQVEAAALVNNPAIMQLRALERWNGIMPLVTGGGAMPFINIPLNAGSVARND